MQKVRLVLLLAATAFLYTIFLDRTPIHLNQDELGFSLNAYSLAKTGFDENGRFFPLYFWHLGVMWATPIIVYLTAIILSVLPLGEIVIRLPSVIIGLINVALIYFLAKRLFKSERWGLASGALLAVTPVHFIHSRILLDVLYIVPFILAWLLLILYFLETKKVWLLLVTGLVLGFGVHSYHAAKVMMPLYFILTFWMILPQIKQQPKLIMLLLIGFILPILPLIPWLSQYPDTLVDQVKYTRLYDTQLGPLSGIVTLLSPESLGHRIDVFLNYFNPYFLFSRGDASFIHSTGKFGVFLYSFAIFLPLGIYFALAQKTRLGLLMVIGFFTAPLAASIAGDHYRISRALMILPFAMILAVYGIQFLLLQRNKILRVTCYLLLVTIPLQFSYFFYDYMTDYRIRSYNWMKYNIPGALETLIAQEENRPSDKIYIDNRIEFVDRYWKFYLTKHDREDLISKTAFFDAKSTILSYVPANTLMLLNFNNVDGLKAEIGPFKKTANIFEPDGISTFYIYRN